MLSALYNCMQPLRRSIDQLQQLASQAKTELSTCSEMCLTWLMAMNTHTSIVLTATFTHALHKKLYVNSPAVSAALRLSNSDAPKEEPQLAVQQ
jgi:hypothetical protein